MMMHVHYCTTTGNIVAWGDGDGGDPFLPGHAVIDIAKREIDAKRHKVDPVTCVVVDKAGDDLAASLRVEIVRAIERELSFTDHFIDPPSDRPRIGPFGIDWRPYREALRRLSDLPSPADMVKAWPPRPNGVDAIAALRSRLAAGL
jgi:hypothetical protein